MSKLLGTDNAAYHADTTHQSSSGLKLLLKDPAKYYEEYVLGNRQNKDAKYFREGSLLHTLVLEPEKLDEQYAIFRGMRRQGKVFDEFVAANPGKVVVSAPELLRAQGWANAVKSVRLCQDMLSNGVPEHSMVGTVLDIPCKSRADYINVNNGYIIDLKSTNSPSETELFKQSLFEFGYDLSAALYCEIARQTYGRDFNFYWIVVSKVDDAVQVYQASPVTLSKGTMQYTKAIVLLKQCLATNTWHTPSPIINNKPVEVITI